MCEGKVIHTQGSLGSRDGLPAAACMNNLFAFQHHLPQGQSRVDVAYESILRCLRQLSTAPRYKRRAEYTTSVAGCFWGFRAEIIDISCTSPLFVQ